MNYINLFFFVFWIMMMFFLYLKHPLLMGLVLIINCFMLCLFINLFSFSSWNSYILFLMFLGGILILTLYNISLISNESFQDFKFIKMMMLLLLMYFMTNFKETFINEMMTFFSKKETSPTIFFLSFYNFNSMMILVIYLFLTLICIVNLIFLMKNKTYKRM